MLLITELNDSYTSFVTEENGKKSLYIEGVFLQAGVANRNKRIYPPPILEREVSRYTKEYINENRAVGELGHPNGPGINLDRISHLVTECRRSGNDYIGKAKIMEGTTCGDTAAALIRNGVKLGVSSRGMGSLKEDGNGVSIVQDDFRLHVMIDIVADPSAPNAFVNGVMEGVEWRMNELGEWVHERVQERTHNIRQELKVLPASLISEQKKIAIFEDFVEELIENQWIDRLSRVTKTDPIIAKNALRRARIHARQTGRIGDQRHVWFMAKKIAQGGDAIDQN